MTHTLTLTHLYPENLNLYGDTGNIIALQRRAEWHGIEITTKSLNIGDTHTAGQTDLYFMGGGQDSDQVKIVEDFHNLKAKAVKEDTENDIAFLGVCGGYQLMGRSYLMGNNEIAKGLGIIDIETKAPGEKVTQRCIGNLIAKIEELTYQHMRKIYHDQTIEVPRTLVGFENHSGQTYILGETVRPLAKTVSGFGNNSEKIYEGSRYKNIFGSYMHGSLLPKNPHFADFLIWLALTKKYNDPNLKLKHLDDSIELEAHRYILNTKT